MGKTPVFKVTIGGPIETDKIFEIIVDLDIDQYRLEGARYRC